MGALKCFQCPTPALYLAGDEEVPLCLDCYYKYAQIQEQQLANHERMMNYLTDEIEGNFGNPGISPRFPPRPAPVYVGGIKLNNISVNNSVVGTINTGSIGSVDQSISALNQLGEPELAEAIKALSEAVLRSNDLTSNQKRDVIDLVSAVAKEAASPLPQRKSSIALPLIKAAKETIDLASDIAEISAKWWPILVAAFS